MACNGETSYSKNVQKFLQSDPKLQKCCVSLKRINISEEKKRLKGEDKVFKNHSHEPVKTTFLKATPKKIIAIKGIGRVTLPKKTRLILKIDTPKGPLILIDRKRLDIKLERLSFPPIVIEETVRYYKDYHEEDEVKKEPVCAPQPIQNDPIPVKTIESKSPKPSISEETLPIKKVKVAPLPQVSSAKASEKQAPKTIPKIASKKVKTTTHFKDLDPRERQLIDLANFIDGHWFAGFHAGPLDIEENIRNAFRLQMSLISLQNQRAAPHNPQNVPAPHNPQSVLAPHKPQNVQAAPVKVVPPFFTRQPMEEKYPPKNKGNTTTNTCQESRNSANEGAGLSNSQGQIIRENKLPSINSSDQGASSENGSKSFVGKVLTVRTFFEKEGEQFVKKVSCPLCLEHVRVDVLKVHMDTNHRTIPTSIGNVHKSTQLKPPSNLPTDKIPAGSVRCKQCKKIMGMNDVLTHSCFNSRPEPDYMGPSVNQNNARGPVLAECSKCKKMTPITDIKLHVCSRNGSQSDNQPASSGASEIIEAKRGSQSQSTFSQELVKCPNCQMVIPKDNPSAHICKQLSGSIADNPNALFKCSKCNNGKLYSSLALKEHDHQFHYNKV